MHGLTLLIALKSDVGPKKPANKENGIQSRAIPLY